MKISFVVYRMGYYVFMAILGGLLMYLVDGTQFIDLLLLSAGSITGAGLSTRSMAKTSPFNLFVMALWMAFGQSSVTTLFILLYRIKCFKDLDIKINTSRNNKLIPVFQDLNKDEQDVINHYYLLYNSLILVSRVLYLYIVTSHIVLGITLLIALYLQPSSEEMNERHISRVEHAAFLSISAFSNSGYTTSSYGLEEFQLNPLAYITLSVMILLGNTLLPIIMRQILSYISTWKDDAYSTPAKFILSNSQNVSPVILRDENDSKLLLRVLLGTNGIQFVVFVILTFSDEKITSKYSIGTLIGLGYFQTVSTRAAGFSIMNMKELSQGIIFLYAVFCYLSPDRILKVINEDNKTNRMKDDMTHNVTYNDMLSYSVKESISHVGSGSRNNAHSLSISDSKYTNLVSTGESSIESVDFNHYDTYQRQVLYCTSLIGKHTNLLLLACLLLASSENKLISNVSMDCNMWYVIFEVLSAYGGVGRSWGAKNELYSLSGMFSPFGKFIIVCVCLLGKHRGSPSEGDPCIDFQYKLFLTAARFYDLTASTEDIKNPIQL